MLLLAIGRLAACSIVKHRSLPILCIRAMSTLQPSNGDVQPQREPGSRKRSSEAPSRQNRKMRKLQTSSAATGSTAEVLRFDAEALFKQRQLENGTPQQHQDTHLPDESTLPARFTEVDLLVETLSSTGDGLARNAKSSTDPRIYAVPFTTPGDIVRAKVIRDDAATLTTTTDLLGVETPGAQRDDSLARCRYFGTCAGCQLQMLPYAAQLAHKTSILARAYQHFSGLDAARVPKIGETIASPLQYGYRTKLTPHFDGPPGARGARRKGGVAKFQETPPIGFTLKGTRRTLDIEECPIGTPAVQMGLRSERARVVKELDKYKRGATLLLRESTKRETTGDVDNGKEISSAEDVAEIRERHASYTDVKTCITDSNAASTEYVGDQVFTNPAGAFFQNNNSILPLFTAYIRSVILPTSDDTQSPRPKITNLIDAYSGSGLFTITLATLFARSIGIDISAASIASATHNAALNGLDASSVRFVAADAHALFASLDTEEPAWQPEETAIVIDPPRKGCDDSFLKQLVAFAPERIVYVSCNVHTQARDVGWILRAGDDSGGKVGSDAKPTYEIESLQGFDFFPQTGHVEGVCVLRRVRTAAESGQ